MDDQDVRELVHIRFELRQLANRGDSSAAAPLLNRMGTLAVRDTSGATRPEMDRWRAVFRLEA